MAQAQYRRAIRPAGFQPVQVGGQEIARMREESSRMAENMRAARDAEVEERRRTQTSMEREQQYTKQAGQRNFEIQTQNDANALRQSQLDAQTAARQFEIQQEATASMFKNVANLSLTASKKLTEIGEARFEEDRLKAFTTYDPSTDATLQQILGEGQLQAQEELRQGAIDEIAANPDTPKLPVAQARALSNGARYGLDQARANYLLTQIYPQQLQKARLENPEIAGDSAATAAFLVNFEREFYQKTGLLSYKPEMLRDGLTSVKSLNQSILTKEQRVEERNLYQIQDDNATTILTQNPTAFLQNVTASFRTWARNPENGYSGALEKFENLATLRNPNGEFLFSMEQLAQATLKPDGQGFAQDWPTRFARMQEARLRSDNAYRQAQMASDDITFKQQEDEILKGLTADPSKANADAAVDFFREAYGRVPQSILQFQASYTTEAIKKAKSVEQLEAIPDGFITQEAVDAMAALDPAAARRLNDRFAAQERRYNSGIFKDTAESFKTIANGATAFGTNKPNTPASIFLQGKMQAVYRKRVDEAVAGGMDFNQAATTIGQQLAAEVKAGLLDPNSVWYRKVSGPGGAAEFPNLNKGVVSAAEQARRRYSQLKKDIQTNGVERVINTKNSIITEQEAQEIVKNYGKPGFTVPQDVLAVAGATRGLDPMTIINAQLAQHGIKPLQPPPSLDTTNQLVSPEFKKLLYKKPTVNTSIRGLGSTNTFNPTIIPNNLGTAIQQASQTAGVNPSFIAALAEIESGFNPNSTSYNGSSFGVMQINRAAHPAFFAQANWRDPQANINYGAQYYSSLLRKYNDPVAAAMAYNAGPGNYDAYLKGQLPDGRVKTEMLNHGKKFAKVMYKYGGGGMALNNPHLMRNGNQKLTASATSYVGMDTSDGPDAGRNACVWALNKVMRAAGMNVPWGDSLYVPFVKQVLDKTARRVAGPVPGAIAVMQDNHPTEPYPHIGIVGADGMIISNSTSRARFDWRGTPQEYEQKYGRPNLYYVLN
jgi:hypothetical protein